LPLRKERKGREGKGKERKGKERKGKERKGRSAPPCTQRRKEGMVERRKDLKDGIK
jgi:hypothetical protein